jgi:hypothetical protein
LEFDLNGPLAEQVTDETGDAPWLALFLVVFAVVVGPLNLFVFAPAKKRYRLFLTTPLIAITASVLLVIVIFVQDGVGGAGVRRSLVVLLPGENQAAIFQEQAARTGFLGRRAFALPEDVQLTKLMLEAPSYGGPETRLARNGAQAGGDWFRNRSREAHLLQRIVPTRGRVEQLGTESSGAPIVQSTLAATLREFVCVGEDGQFWKTAELAPGKRVVLERGGMWLGEFVSPLVPGGSFRFREIFQVVTSPTAGQWTAKGGASELAPISTLGSIRWTSDEVYYAGTLSNRASGSTTLGATTKPGGQP